MDVEKENFKHHFSAHCETGVISSLFEERSLSISEPMAFGIGSGLFFVFLPFVKVMGNPLVSYRSFPGTIFKKVCKRLGVKYKSEKFRSEQSGVKRLSDLIGQGEKVGVQANIYWLNYIPKNFRFHFNAHNLIILGEDDQKYRVSDPLLEEITDCPKDVMSKARFSKGPLAPKGLIYYIGDKIDKKPALEVAIRTGIKETVRRMYYNPVPFVGLKAIGYLSRSIRKWPKKAGDKRAKLYLASVVRMQEEIGTGGAGFRYIYSSFLKESADLLKNESLDTASKMMEDVADEWRLFAQGAVRACKSTEPANFDGVADHLMKLLEMEKTVYQFLDKEFL